MKAVFKTSSLLCMVLFIPMIILAGPTLSFATGGQQCPEGVLENCSEECTATVKTWTYSDDRWPRWRIESMGYDVGIVEDSNGQWPVVVEMDNGMYQCGKDAENYPCLAWPYQVTTDDMADLDELTQISILIPNCCDDPITILQTSDNEVVTTDCLDCTSVFEGICSGYELQVTQLADNGTFWFTTPENVGKHMIDVQLVGDLSPKPCLTGIKGPGCATPNPEVKVEPVTQCFQFTAENQPPDGDCNPESSTWAILTYGRCNVDVYAAYGDSVTCDNVVTNDNKIDPQQLQNVLKTEDGEVVTSYLTVDECDTAWLQSIEPDTGCNKRCYKIAGRLYCR